MVDALYALAGVGLAGLTLFLVWINWQILQVSKRLLKISVDLLEETIIIKADQCDVDGAAGAGAIALIADAGGISLNAAAGKDIFIEGILYIILFNKVFENGATPHPYSHIWAPSFIKGDKISVCRFVKSLCLTHCLNELQAPKSF